MPGDARRCKNMQRDARKYKKMPGDTRTCQEMSGHARTCQDMPGYDRWGDAMRCQEISLDARRWQEMRGDAMICQDMPGYARICKDMQGDARTFQEMPGVIRSSVQLLPDIQAAHCTSLQWHFTNCILNCARLISCSTNIFTQGKWSPKALCCWCKWMSETTQHSRSSSHSIPSPQNL